MLLNKWLSELKANPAKACDYNQSATFSHYLKYSKFIEKKNHKPNAKF